MTADSLPIAIVVVVIVTQEDDQMGILTHINYRIFTSVRYDFSQWSKSL